MVQDGQARQHRVVAYTTPLATLITGARYFAMMLMPSVCSGPQIMFYKTLHLHVARPFPKRAAGVAMINTISGLSNVWGGYLYGWHVEQRQALKSGVTHQQVDVGWRHVGY
ncbi:hypothetical protein SPI_03787 [Niveomyces insectorum RCEF 264]|uniref:Major facilitator superfamily domain, general substrate transporter n=1 Tax=Niveomyces insectorum RCEF 264 TaxID=1081102 RepID=A0A167WCV2_9HYPO|nr:hypothetical protein SPI_03787 [Niveomyces insectorum RCEF 264]